MNDELDFFDEPRSFIQAMLLSKKYKEFLQIESIFALICSILLLLFFYFFIKDIDIEKYNELFKNISLYLGSGFLGLLGFTLTGLAFTIGSFGNDLFYEIKEKPKRNALYSIFFSFVFLGFISCISSIYFYMMYLIMYTNFKINTFSYILIYIGSYLFLFSLFFSIGLLQTCINLLAFYLKLKNNEE